MSTAVRHRASADEASNACAVLVARAKGEYCDEMRAASVRVGQLLDSFADECSTSVRAVTSAQEAFEADVLDARLELERALADARASKRDGADKAKRAVRACLKRAEYLRERVLPRLRALADRASGEEAQVSRRILGEFRDADARGRATFERLVEFDRYIAQEATRIDATSLVALVEDCLGSSGGTLGPEESQQILELYEGECVVARRLSILPKSAPFRDVPTTTTAVAPPTPPTPPRPTEASTARKLQTMTLDAAPAGAFANSRASAARARAECARELAAVIRGFLAGRLRDEENFDVELDQLVDEFLAARDAR